MAYWTESEAGPQRIVPEDIIPKVEEYYKGQSDGSMKLINRRAAERRKRFGLIGKSLVTASAVTYAWLVSHNSDTILMARNTDEQLLVGSGNFTKSDGLSVTGPNRFTSALIFAGPHPEVVLTLPDCGFRPEFKLEDAGTKREYLSTTISHSSENTFIQNGHVLSDRTVPSSIPVAIHDSQELGAYERQYLQGPDEVCHVAPGPQPAHS